MMRAWLCVIARSMLGETRCETIASVGGSKMSVLVTIRMNGDVDTFRRALSERSGEFAKNSERGRESGAVHHQFGVGDGYVLVVDEWESAEKFQAFFSDPELQKFIGEVGGDTSAPPDITVVEAVASADKF